MLPYVDIAIAFLKNLTPKNILIIVLICSTAYFYVDANYWMKWKVDAKNKEIAEITSTLDKKKTDLATCNNGLIVSGNSIDNIKISVKALQDLVRAEQVEKEKWRKKYSDRCDVFRGATNVTPKDGEVIDNEHSKAVIDFINDISK